MIEIADKRWLDTRDGSLGIGGPPDPSAALDLRLAKGLALPRCPVRPANPRPGLVLYNAGSNVVEYWNGTAWVATGGGGAWSPTALPGAVDWYDFNDLTTQFTTVGGVTNPANDGDPGRQINSKGPGAHNLTGSAPLTGYTIGKAANGINGLTVGRFNTAHSSVATTGVRAVFAQNQPIYYFLVCRVTYNNAQAVLFDGGTADACECRVDFADNTKLDVYAGAFLTQLLPVNLNTAHQLAFLFNGASSQLWQDGASFATGNVGAGNPGGLTLGSYGDNTGTRPVGVDIGEFFSAVGPLAPADLTSAFNYLHTRWGVT